MPTIRAARAAERQAYVAACRVEKLREQLRAAIVKSGELDAEAGILWAELRVDHEAGLVDAPMAEDKAWMFQRGATVCDGQGWIVDGKIVPV